MPNPPENLTQTDATQTSVTIDWTASSTGSAPDSYERRIDAGPITDVGLATSTTFIDLAAGTSYTVELRSVDSSSYAEKSITLAPQVYYRTNETAGTVAEDFSGNDRDGAYVGGPTLNQPSLLVNDSDASVLLAADDYINVPDAAWMDVPAFTIIAWVKSANFATTAPIAVRDGGSGSNRVFRFDIDPDGSGNKMRFVRWTSAGSGLTVDGTLSVATGVSRMVAVTHDGSTIKLYLDGVEDGSAADPSGLNVSATAAMKIGGDGFRSVGPLDEFKMFNYALSQAQIADLYTAGANGTVVEVSDWASILASTSPAGAGRIEWNKAGEREFEAGVDRGVLYPRLGPGVPWNGLTSVSEDSSGGDMESLYFDGTKYLDVVAGEDFQATIDAYSAPAEFAISDGQKALSPGLFVTQQPRKTFGFCYRTLKGNDLVGTEHGYKLHIVYNCTAAPSARSNVTLASNVTPGTRSWTIHTVPPPATTFKPTAHIVLDSNLIDPFVMEQLEGALYGHDGADPYLPTVAEIVLIMDSRITELITEFV